MARQWIDYDPSWLVELAHEQAPSLVEALRRCTKALVKSEAYTYFVSSERANQPGSEWQISHSVRLEHSEQGTLVLDVLKDGRVGGVEFLSRI